MNQIDNKDIKNYKKCQEKENILKLSQYSSLKRFSSFTHFFNTTKRSGFEIQKMNNLIMSEILREKNKSQSQ